MLFLISYQRSLGIIRHMTTFPDAQRRAAEDARLDLELEFNRGSVQDEIVLLEASSEEALRLTHQRYFESLAGLARSSAWSTGSS